MTAREVRAAIPYIAEETEKSAAACDSIARSTDGLNNSAGGLQQTVSTFKVDVKLRRATRASGTLDELIGLVRQHTGIAMNARKGVLLRPSSVRACARSPFPATAVSGLVRSGGPEVQAFVDMVTTNDTVFFRTPAVWDYLERDFLPAWQRPTRASACASGRPPPPPARKRIRWPCCATSSRSAMPGSAIRSWAPTFRPPPSTRPAPAATAGARSSASRLRIRSCSSATSGARASACGASELKLHVRSAATICSSAFSAPALRPGHAAQCADLF